MLVDLCIKNDDAAALTLFPKEVLEFGSVHLAVEHRAFPCITVLANAGAEMDLFDQKKRTPMEVAIQQNDHEMVSCLLQYVNVHGGDETYACRYNSLACLKELTNSSAIADQWGYCSFGLSARRIERFPFHEAIANHDHEAFDRLVNCGCDINELEGWLQVSPLFISVHYQNERACQKLIELGAKDIPCLWSYSALMAAVYHGKLATVKELVERGSDIHQCYFDSRMTLLYVAARHDYPEIVEYLLSLGLEPDFVAEHKTEFQYDPVQYKMLSLSPLSAAVKNGNLVCVKLLLHARAIPTIHHANYGFQHPSPNAFRKYREVLNYLLEHDADIDVQCENFGETLLMKAIFDGELDLIYYLLEKGASVKPFSKDKRDALDYAKVYNCPEIIRMIEERSACAKMQ